MGRERLSRRVLMAGGLLALGAGCGTPATKSSGKTSRRPGWTMPDEGDPHTRTWMAFGASKEIWGAGLLPVVRRNLAAVAEAITEFEPVTMLVRPDEVRLAESLLHPDVTIHPLEIDDLWIRDTGPCFVVRDGERGLGPDLGGVDLNFNGWGGKQDHRYDARVARAVTRSARAKRIGTDLVMEGGALEVDGHGTAIITESCVLNDNRNPGWSKADVEAELQHLFGIEKVIWLPGIAGHDITDGHTDFYARFAGPGQVVAALDDDPESFDYDVTRTHLRILRRATDARGRALTVTTLTAPTELRATDAGDDFAAGYINYYLCNGGLILPQFGDRTADAAARRTLARLFPDRAIRQVDIDGIAAGGGGIHCATQQQPRP